MEYISATEVSPLISKCYVKVCYVGQEPNRNNTVITKELAYKLGKKLPGSPVVGYYNESLKDFEGHNREVQIGGGKLKVVDVTRPYGFVPPNARVWFQKFRDDDGVEREYLVTECYIWTGAYPESQRIITQGNNHSMELSKEFQEGFWAEADNSRGRIFIYNEALIEKLCILGENVEPCFEGAQFKTEFSLENNPEFQEFKRTMFSMITELQNTLNEGGSQGPMEENKDLVLNPENEFEKKTPEQEEEKQKEIPTSAPADGDNKPEDKPAEDDKKDKKNYTLEEVTEYVELKAQYEELQGKYSALEQDKANLEAEVSGLKEFKLQAERKDKQSMIDSFYMLTDEDKKEVVEHIDTYSLDDIEAKLSVICVRNKVDFNLNKPQEQEEQKPDAPTGMFNLNGAEEQDNAPDWVKAVRNTAKKN